MKVREFLWRPMAGHPENFVILTTKFLFVFSTKIILHCVCTPLSVVIGSGNGLVPIREQAVTWVIDNQDVWFPMMSVGHSELISSHYLIYFFPSLHWLCTFSSTCLHCVTQCYDEWRNTVMSFEFKLLYNEIWPQCWQVPAINHLNLTAGWGIMFFKCWIKSFATLSGLIQQMLA